MTKKIPLTYLLCGRKVPDEWIPTLFAEFAANGAENIAINETMAPRLTAEPRYYASLDRMAREAGVRLFEMHAPFGECWDLNCSVQSRRKKMVEEHIEIMNYAAEIGCRTYVIHVGAWDCIFRPEITIEKMRDLARESLERLLPAAERAGIIIAVENSFEMSNAPEEVLGLLKAFDSPALGCCFDTGHANYMAPARDGRPKNYSEYQVNKAWRGHLVEEPEAVKKLLPWIVTCHLHDNNGLGDQHNLPGRGTIDWEQLMPELLGAPRLVSCQSEVGFLLYNIPIRTLCETMSRLVGGN